MEQLPKNETIAAEITLPEKENILLVGDSIARGVTYDTERSRHIILKDSAAALIEKSCSFAVKNMAKFGATVDVAAKQLARFLQKAEEKPEEKAEVVVIEVGGNDSDFDWNAIAETPGSEHSPKTSLSVFTETLSGMIESAKQKCIRPVLCNLPPIDADRYFRYFTGGSKEKGDRVLQWLGTVGRIYWWHERYNAAVEHVGEVTKTPVINVRRAFLEAEDYRKYIAEDGLHPNEEGQKVMANEIASYVRRNCARFLLT